MIIIKRMSVPALLGAACLATACSNAALDRLKEVSTMPRFVYTQMAADKDGTKTNTYRAAAVTESDQMYQIKTRPVLEGASSVTVSLVASPGRDRYLAVVEQPLENGRTEVWVEVLTPDLDTVFLASDDDTAAHGEDACDRVAMSYEMPEVQDFLDSEIAFGALQPGAVAEVHLGSSGRPLGDGAGWLSDTSFYVTIEERLEYDVDDPKAGLKKAYARTREEVIYHVVYSLEGRAYEATKCDLVRQINAPVPATQKNLEINEFGYLLLDGAVLEAEETEVRSSLGPDVTAVAGPYPVQ